jgi:hypothetical protein
MGREVGQAEAFHREIVDATSWAPAATSACAACVLTTT